MECDTLHSCIERKSEGGDNHLPIDYLWISWEARNKSNSYKVKSMHLNDFKNFTGQGFHRYKSVRHGKVRNIFVPYNIISIMTFSRLSIFLWWLMLGPLDISLMEKYIISTVSKMIEIHFRLVLRKPQEKLFVFGGKEDQKQKWQHPQLLKSVSDYNRYYNNIKYIDEWVKYSFLFNFYIVSKYF